MYYASGTVLKRELEYVTLIISTVDSQIQKQPQKSGRFYPR